MAFFEKLTDAVTNTGAAVGNKAKELTEIAKIKNEITTQERKIKEEYEKIGKLYVLQGNKPIEVPELHAGDIGALAKFTAA